MSIYQCRIKSCSHTHFTRPLRDITCAGRIEFAIGFMTICSRGSFSIGIVSWVSTVIGRYSVRLRLTKNLNIIRPLRCSFRILYSTHKHMTDIILCQIICLSLCQINAIRISRLGIKHQATQSVNRKLLRKVSCSLHSRQSPILIHIQTSISVQILESKAVNHQNRRCRISQGRTSTLMYQGISVPGFICNFIFTTGKDDCQEK